MTNSPDFKPTGCGSRVLEFLLAIVLYAFLKSLNPQLFWSGVVALFIDLGMLWLFLVYIRNLCASQKHCKLRAAAMFGTLRLQLVLGGLSVATSWVKLFAVLATSAGAQKVELLAAGIRMTIIRVMFCLAYLLIALVATIVVTSVRPRLRLMDWLFLATLFLEPVLFTLTVTNVIHR